METPRHQVRRGCFTRGRSGGSFGSYGSPPPSARQYERYCSREAAAAQGIVAQMQGMQLDEAVDRDMAHHDWQQQQQQQQHRQQHACPTPGMEEEEEAFDWRELPRLPFQPYAANRRHRRESTGSFDLMSPPMDLMEEDRTPRAAALSAENLPPGFLPPPLVAARCRSNSFLVQNAPRLPASPELDDAMAAAASSDPASHRGAAFLPPPIFSPVHKYSVASVGGGGGGGAVAFGQAPPPATPAQSPAPPPVAATHGPRPAPPSMPLIGSPAPPAERTLLRMRRGYADLPAPLFSAAAAVAVAAAASSPAPSPHSYGRYLC